MFIKIAQLAKDNKNIEMYKDWTGWKAYNSITGHQAACKYLKKKNYMYYFLLALLKGFPC